MKRAVGSRAQARGYVTILHALRQKPDTTYGLTQRLGMRDGTVRSLMAGFVHLKLAHVKGYTRGEDNQFRIPVPVFAEGEGKSVPVLTKTGEPRVIQYGAKPPKLTADMILLASVKRALLAEPMHGKALAEAAGIMHTTALRLLRHMHALRFVHIAEWMLRAQGGAHAALYAWGEKPDAPRPVALPKSELFRIHARQRAARDRAARQALQIATTPAWSVLVATLEHKPPTRAHQAVARQLEEMRE